ncbi:hypothetical protein BF93_16545 [Brachybacterium phenoliresistens]|uniref:Uncharacterized protein n=1 Tax=Brachybacterium phenoliresistens TaxID=396014 RepID=Z9JTR2_9MICO|nr:hypothetical protein [Brachybacterium phenoliresistens]EWS81418.1 hypothetical protein BF93_16545 [Brachybacterium phenoliresistens]
MADVRRRSRTRLVVPAALVVAVLLVTAVVVGLPDAREGLLPGPAGPASPSAAPSPRPQDELDAPGYDPDPGPLALPDIAASTAEPVTASFAVPEGAQRWDGSIGLSFEATDLASPLWGSESSNLDEMLEALDSPVLRFGGNSVDRRMWWTSSGESAPDWAEATVTPADLQRVAAAAEAADASVTITLDLGHDDPQRAADMAAHAREAFGRRLLAVSIGNEPNGFFHANQPQLAVRDDSWDTDAYRAALTEHSAAIEAVAPGTPIAGPGAYDAPWWRAFAESGIPHQRALTMHWYPLWDCSGPASSIANPTVEDLTSPALRERARQLIGMGAQVAEQHDLPLWMEETGPTSCPGTNATSRTHAQALWTGDYALTAAESGVERLAFHATLQACQGGAPMSPVCATGSLDRPGGLLRGRTSFLAMLQLAQLPAGTVLAPAVSGDGRIMVHAVLGDDGTLGVMIVDLRDPEGAAPVPVQLSAPGGLDAAAPTAWTLADGSLLAGDSLEAPSSRLGAPAAPAGALAQAPLGRGAPLSVASTPGSTLLLRFAPVAEAAPSDGGGASDQGGAAEAGG